MRSVRIVTIVVTLQAGFITAKDQSSNDPIQFFKNALSSPPEIEQFDASLRRLREPMLKELRKLTGITNLGPQIQYFTGARSGSNFFLISDIPQKMISGRYGSSAYTVTTKGLALGFEGFDPKNPTNSDRISQGSDSSFGLISQFLQMGNAYLSHSTVSWSGNEFVGMSDQGRLEYGRLELSNNLPWSLSLSWTKAASPFKVFHYEYPNPVWALEGFPKTIVISSLLNGKLQESLELSFFHVQLANHILTAEFFDPRRFTSTNTLFTNIWSKTQLTSISPGKKSTVSIAALNKDDSRRMTSGPRRLVVYVVLLLLTLGLPVALLFGERRLRKSTNKPEKTKG